MSHFVTCRDLEKSFGAQLLFRGISLSFDDNERVGLIGPNGSGKSTLLKILAGLEHEDQGAIFRRKGGRIVYLAQEEGLHEEAGVLQVVEAALADEPDEAVRHARALRALGQAGFDDPNQDCAALSGGWRKRLAIARALAQEPDLLLLDEPTNHLDLPSILWLEKVLAGARFAYVLVSHDRSFLSTCCIRIVELNRCFPQGFFSRDLSFERFLDAREEFLEQQRGLEDSLANRMRRETEWLRRGPKARATKARARIDAAGRLDERLGDLRERNREDRRLNVGFDATGRQTKKLLELDRLGKSLGDRPLFADLDLVLGPGVRVGLVGGNGCGKTTLMHCMAGRLEPDSGQVRLAEGVQVLLFDQKRDQLDQEQSLRRALAPEGDSIVFQGRSVHVVAWARRFLFQADQLDMPVGQLSGGEQARILIARLMRCPADILLLDEPTNDLDVGAISVLEEGLLEFPGAMVLVSHDRVFLDNVATTVIGFDGQGGTCRYGDCAQWIAAMNVRAGAPKKDRAGKAAEAGPTQAGSGGKLTYAERIELTAMEEVLLGAEEELESWQGRLEDPAVSTDPARLAECCEQIGILQEQVDGLYARWEELEEKQRGMRDAAPNSAGAKV